jgi:hypothetical protein
VCAIHPISTPLPPHENSQFYGRLTRKTNGKQVQSMDQPMDWMEMEIGGMNGRMYGMGIGEGTTPSPSLPIPLNQWRTLLTAAAFPSPPKWHNSLHPTWHSFPPNFATSVDGIHPLSNLPSTFFWQVNDDPFHLHPHFSNLIKIGPN